MDALDVKVIDLLAVEPRIGVLEASRRLGVARGTVQARLDKLESTGVIIGWGPDLSPAALGYPVTAFLTLTIRQVPGRTPHHDGGNAGANDWADDWADDAVDDGGHDAAAAHLARIPEVLEAHTITGAGDLWCRVVARSNADLQRVIDQVLGYTGVDRSTTVIALATQVAHRTRPLARASLSESAGGWA